MDILPYTRIMLVVSHPGRTFRRQEAVVPLGKLRVDHLSSPIYRDTTMHAEDIDVHGWELLGQWAISECQWKAV